MPRTAARVLRSRLALLLAAVPQPAAAEPLFAAPFLSFDTAPNPVSVAVADLDGDGKLDVLTMGGYMDGVVSFLPGHGDGTYGAATDRTIGFDRPGAGRAMLLSDLDGDGHLDLVAADPDTAFVSVLLGNGDGTFGPRSAFAVAGYPCALAAARPGRRRPPRPRRLRQPGQPGLGAARQRRRHLRGEDRLRGGDSTPRPWPSAT